MNTENIKRGFIQQVIDGARVGDTVGKNKHATMLALFGIGVLGAGIPVIMNWGRDALLAGTIIGMLLFFLFGYYIKETETALGKDTREIEFVKPKKYKYGRY